MFLLFYENLFSYRLFVAFLFLTFYPSTARSPTLSPSVAPTLAPTSPTDVTFTIIKLVL